MASSKDGWKVQAAAMTAVLVFQLLRLNLKGAERPAEASYSDSDRDLQVQMSGAGPAQLDSSAPAGNEVDMEVDRDNASPDGNGADMEIDPPRACPDHGYEGDTEIEPDEFDGAAADPQAAGAKSRSDRSGSSESSESTSENGGSDSDSEMSITSPAEDPHPLMRNAELEPEASSAIKMDTDRGYQTESSGAESTEEREAARALIRLHKKARTQAQNAGEAQGQSSAVVGAGGAEGHYPGAQGHYPGGAQGQSSAVAGAEGAQGHYSGGAQGQSSAVAGAGHYPGGVHGYYPGLGGAQDESSAVAGAGGAQAQNSAVAGGGGATVWGGSRGRRAAAGVHAHPESDDEVTSLRDFLAETL